MKYLSLFSGIGGFELGITQAYESTRNIDVQKVGGREKNKEGKYEKGKGLHTLSSQTAISSQNRDYEHIDGSIDEGQSHCVGFSEIDKYATAVYQKHFPEHKNYGDITKIKEEELPDFELIVGGFPCQSFSIAGKRGGFSDTRGTLFFDIARIIKSKRPRLLLLENVKGLLSHDEGKTFRTIITTLDELGYDLQWQVLNSKNFGVPQNRERVFIVGHLRGTPRPQVFPIGKSNAGNIESQGQTQTKGQWLRGNTASTLAARDYKGGGNLIEKPFITNPKMMNHKRDYGSSVAITATSYKEPPVVSNVRRLTPMECERLQGFPDGWTEGISDSQRYKCCGNAVTVNVIQAIMEILIHTPSGQR